jgi:CPA2 family monovalent cation:H+ antiporter-2
LAHETALIETIAISLTWALVMGLVAARVGLPPLIGYLAAGIIVGPFTPGFVADIRLAPQLAEIGVILLMFGVGMHVSLRDLIAKWRIVIPGAASQIVISTSICYLISTNWGWGPGAGLVFRFCLSIASTVVLVRALEALGAMHASEGRIAVAWLVAEDVLTVLALVALPAIAAPLGAAMPDSIERHAGSGQVWTDLALAVLRVVAFVAVILPIGGRVFPVLLEFVSRTGSRELFTLTVVAIALGVAFAAATLLGLSYALGAFFAGVVIRQSDHGNRAALDTLPIQDSFAVLFFVSVGMLFDPAALVRDPLRIAAAATVIVIAKPAAAFVIARLAGCPARVAVTVSMGLGQIGEFSFILASEARELGMLPDDAVQVILGGALISIAVNPLAMRVAARYTLKRNSSTSPSLTT